MHFFVYLFFLYVHFLNPFFAFFLALADIGRQGVWGYILAFQAAGHNKIAEKRRTSTLRPSRLRKTINFSAFFEVFCRFFFLFFKLFGILYMQSLMCSLSNFFSFLFIYVAVVSLQNQRWYGRLGRLKEKTENKWTGTQANSGHLSFLFSALKKYSLYAPKIFRFWILVKHDYQNGFCKNIVNISKMAGIGVHKSFFIIFIILHIKSSE